MNDFTKEELKYLYNTVDNNCEFFKEPDIAYSIRDKIKSMIDNYCEILIPKMDKYCCSKCNEVWIECECKNDNQ